MTATPFAIMLKVCISAEEVIFVAQVAMTGQNRDRVMSNELNPKSEPDQPLVYQIRIKGHLGRLSTEWFRGLAITLEEGGDTLITGPVVDQSALHGLLRKVRDLGLPLISVIRVKPGQTDVPDVKP
jgi:hypothetical protein